MQIDHFNIEGPVLFTPNRYGDDRGYFMETYRQDIMSEAIGHDVDFIQDNQSLSARKGTIRGLHYQAPPFAQGKLIRCLKGEIFDIAVDVRQGSSTYGQYIRVHLSEGNNRQIWVPPGFLHGFSTLAGDTIVFYKVTKNYAPDHEGSVRFDDPDLAIDWGVPDSDVHLSPRDQTGPLFKDWISPFSI